MPEVYRRFQLYYPSFNLCPTITATEYKGCATDARRASRWFGRRATVEECAEMQGMTKALIKKWLKIPDNWGGTKVAWDYHLYTAIGNGVPVYMAKAFGLAFKAFYSKPGITHAAPWRQENSLVIKA
jgi:site-specific DNA-cytosine methylase